MKIREYNSLNDVICDLKVGDVIYNYFGFDVIITAFEMPKLSGIILRDYFRTSSNTLKKFEIEINYSNFKFLRKAII